MVNKIIKKSHLISTEPSTTPLIRRVVSYICRQGGVPERVFRKPFTLSYLKIREDNKCFSIYLSIWDGGYHLGSSC
jgi:hypothetical protein